MRIAYTLAALLLTTSTCVAQSSFLAANARPSAASATPPSAEVLRDEVAPAGGVVYATDDLNVAPVGYDDPRGGHGSSSRRAPRQARFTGWSVGVGILPLTAKQSNAAFTFDGDGGGDGWQVDVGYETMRGRGVRVSGFGFSNDTQNLRLLDGSNSVVTSEFSTSRIDIDAYQRIWVGDTSIVLAVGPRIANTELSPEGVPTFWDIDAVGVGASAEITMPYYETDRSIWSLIGSAGISAMGGDANYAPPAGGPTVEIDTTLGITEATFGIEWRRLLTRGDLFVRYLFEAQNWESNFTPDTTLAGASFRIGYQW